MTKTNVVQRSKPGDWPALPYTEWKDTCATLHMWTQIAGKIRLVQTPWVNHSWHTTLYLTSRGLTTSPIPYGAKTFQIDFDFLDHKLFVHCSDNQSAAMELTARSVADFYRELFSKLSGMNIHIEINKTPNELPDPIPFDQDTVHASYDPEYAKRFWLALVQIDRVFKIFRARYIGKCSPVHFFWGSFDLAVTRFSGRRAPEHPGGVPHLPDRVVREAYSREVSSCGFWPGNDQAPEPLFYSYAYPEPETFRSMKVSPDAAHYHPDLREFVLPYEYVRNSQSPDDVLLDFMQTTYEAAANSGNWDRGELEIGGNGE